MMMISIQNFEQKKLECVFEILNRYVDDIYLKF